MIPCVQHIEASHLSVAPIVVSFRRLSEDMLSGQVNVQHNIDKTQFFARVSHTQLLWAPMCF